MKTNSSQPSALHGLSCPHSYTLLLKRLLCVLSVGTFITGCWRTISHWAGIAQSTKNTESQILIPSRRLSLRHLPLNVCRSTSSLVLNQLVTLSPVKMAFFRPVAGLGQNSALQPRPVPFTAWCLGTQVKVEMWSCPCVQLINHHAIKTYGELEVWHHQP
jgi:hypothetical protein